jgi:hypothetical protein
MIEVMAAMLILALVCVAYSQNQVAAIQLVKATRFRNTAVMLATEKMAELNFIVQTKGIEEIKDEDKGDFDQENFEGYTWQLVKKNVPPPDFSALLSQASAGESEDGEAAPQQANLEGPMKSIMDIWGKSIIELRLEILWKEGEQDKSYSLMTHYITSDATKQIQGFIGGMMSAYKQGAGGGDSTQGKTP